MLPFAADDPRPIHFVGIAGAGMSALAQLATRRGAPVTGCDTNPTAASELAESGVQILAGHDPGHVVGARAVVYTAAVPADHPELAAARRAGIPVIRRADALADAVAGRTVIAVAGTHGKTTTTAMVTEALAAAGRDPTGLVGGRVGRWRGNAWLGGDSVFVVEADEYDKAFLALEPTVAVVNNVEADHLECYGSVDRLEAAFVEFASRAERVLAGADDGGASRVARTLSVPVWRVGLAAAADLRLSDVTQRPHGSQARLALPGGRTVSLRLGVPGLHNVRNAAMAVGAALAVDAALEPVLEALGRFEGVGRRFDVLGTFGDVTVVDDYAHHPTEVTATLAAARQRFPSARIVAVFQPHLYSRTRAMGRELGIALSAADRVVVTEVYPAREAPIPGITGKLVARAAERAGVEVDWVPDKSELVDYLTGIAAGGDVVLTLGAGDITEVGHRLAARLGERAS
jgi:UDP-N-acetylmuramate--alanine ligase